MLRVIVNYDVTPHFTYTKSLSVVHLFAFFSSTHLQFLFPLFDITASILFTFAATTITIPASVVMISFSSLYFVAYELFALAFSCGLF